MSVYRYVNNTDTDVSGGSHVVKAHDFLQLTFRSTGLEPYVNNPLDLYKDWVEQNNYAEKIVDSSGNQTVTGTLVSLIGVPGLGNPISVVQPVGEGYTSVQFYRNGVAIPGATSSPYIQVAEDIPGIGASVTITAMLSGITKKSTGWKALGPPIVVTVPGKPATPVLSAASEGVLVTWTSPSDGNSSILASEYMSLNGVITQLTTNPQLIPATPGVATTGAVRSRNIVGFGPYSDQSNSMIPLAPAVRLVATNWRYPAAIDVVSNTTETIGRNAHSFGSGNCKNLKLRMPTACNGNSGDILAGAFSIQAYLEFRGITRPFLFSGQVLRNIAAGEIGVISDAIDPAPWGITEFPVGERFYVRYKMIRANDTVGVAAGHIIAQDLENACYTYNPTTVTSASSVSGTGAMTMTASSYLSPRLWGYSPMPIGEFTVPVGKVAFGVIGASMEDAATDVTWTAPLISGRGFMRATYAADGISSPLAGGCIAASGNSTTAIGGVNTLTYDYYKYFTHIEESIGGNDLGSLNGSTLRQKYFDIELFRRQLWAIMRVNSPGVKIACLIKPPCITASSDGFTSDTGQTIGNEWGMYNGTTAGGTPGLGEYYRTWNVDQLNTSAASNFTASINNVIMTVTALTQPGRRLYIGDTITAAGYVGKISNQNATNPDGTGSYTVTPAIPAGLSSRVFTATVTTGTGCDFVFGTEDNTYPGRRDLWKLANTTGLGLPGNAPLGVPSLIGSGGNHPATNHYWLMSRRLRRDFLGFND